MTHLSGSRSCAVSLLILFSVLLVATVPASAAFNYKGTVYYENGTPVEGANVSLEQVNSNTVHSNISNASGHFNVSGVGVNNNYNAKVRLKNSNGNVTHTSKNVPQFPGSVLSTVGHVNYTLRPAVTLNVTAYDPTSNNTDAKNSTGNILPNFDTGLEVLNDTQGDPYVYINASGNLTKVNSTTWNVTGNSTNTIPNVSGATALTYNGSGGYYAANSTDLVKFKNDATNDYNLTKVNNWTLPTRYTDVQDLEYRNESGQGYVYLWANYTFGNWGFERIYTNNGTAEKVPQSGSQFGGIESRRIEHYNGNWYTAVNASTYNPGETWELKKLDSNFNTLKTWVLPQGEKVRGLVNHPSSGWAFNSINTGDKKGRGRTLTLPDPTVKSFKYQVKDTNLGYPVASKFTGSVTQENIVLPANRDYGIELHPTNSMPTSKSVKNIKQNDSWKDNKKIDVRFNVSEKPLWIEGYANTPNTSMGSAGFDKFTVIPYLLQTGKKGVPMAYKQNPHQFPRNLSAIRSPNPKSDNYTASEGYYNITQIGSAETARILLFYTAYNSSEKQYYGGFSDLTLNATQDDVTGQNITLQPLKGNKKNITTSVITGTGLNQVNVTAGQRNFTIQNESKDTKAAHVEARVNYSSTFSNLDTAFTWLTTTGDGNFSIPILNTSIEEVNVYPSGGGNAPKKTSLDKSRIQNSPVLINVSKIQPGSPDGSAFGDIDVGMYKSDTDTNVPNPNESKSLIPKGDLANFNPLTAIIGGGDLSFRMTKTSSNITVHYVNTDLLASGPPDALFDDSSSTSKTDGTLKEAWRFGSQGPTIYDHVLLGMPYNAANHPNDAEFTVEIGKFYDDDWNVIWNASTNTTSEVPSHYSEYTDPEYKGYIDGSGITASKTDPNSTVYVDTSSHMVWMKIPHFSGISPSISSQSPSTTTTTGGTSTSPAAAPPSLGDGTVVKQYQKLTSVVTKPGEPAEVQMPEGSPVKNLRVTTNRQSIDPSFAAGEHSEKPSDVTDPSPTRSVQKYISITTSIPDKDIDSAEIDFSVEQTWLNDNGFERDEVILMRHSNDQWQDLETEFLGEADGELQYSAQSPGFSVFAVSGEKKTAAATQTATPTPTETKTPEATETATPTKTTTPMEETPTPEKITPGFTWIVALSALGAALVIRIKRE